MSDEKAWSENFGPFLFGGMSSFDRFVIARDATVS